MSSGVYFSVCPPLGGGRGQKYKLSLGLMEKMKKKGKREKRKRKKGRGKGKGGRGKREGKKNKNQIFFYQYQKCFKKLRRDLEINLFRAPKRSIIPRKSKNILCRGGAKIWVLQLIYTPAYKPILNNWFRRNYV